MDAAGGIPPVFATSANEEPMRTDRVALVLTVINLLLLASQLPRAVAASTPAPAPMLRGRGLEIVDDQGRRRAQIILLPATRTPQGSQPETVLFRLIDPNGRPGVKIGTSEDGSGMSVAGDSKQRDWSGVQLLAGDTGSMVKLTNRDGRVRVFEP
jgi:hypothetical protein